MKTEIELEAEKYAENKSSSDVFRKTHIRDFIAGATSEAAKKYWFEQFKKK